MSSPAAPRLSAPRALILLALWLLVTAGLRPLLLPDEGRYVGVARDMLLSGDWLTPRLDGLPYFHKPPLMYWIDAAAMALMGVNQFSARMAPFAGAWLMGAALFLAVRRWHGERAAAVALVVLATTPFVYIGGQYANLDMLVAGCITATILAFARALDETRPPLRWIAAGWALAALGVLAKGLIGIVLPALVIGPWLLWQRRWRDVLRLLHPLGLAVFAAIALPWFVAMQERYAQFFDYFVMEQHVRRFATKDFNNPHAWWFYLVVLPALTLPWSAWLPASWRALRERWDSADRAHLGLYAWWIVAIVLFFSLPVSKLVGYVLPAVAPWCLLLAAGALRHPRRMRATAIGSALLCVALALALVWKAPRSTRPAATAMAASYVRGDRVVVIDNMFFDLPFYLGLTQPVIVVSDWDSPEIALHDNWRKEMADAARFDPARAREVLWPRARVSELSCHAQAVWYVMERGAHPELAAVPGLTTVYAEGEVVVMRSPARAC